jgi:SAM-dependent methyltransferase
MTIGERVLLAFSRDPARPDYPMPGADWDPAHALDRLTAVYPSIRNLIAGKDVLDFGCGTGRQVIAMAQQGARSVVGIDTNTKLLAPAERLARDAGVSDRVAFLKSFDEADRPRFDVIISQNSMEHFPDPSGVLEQMKALLRTGGAILISFSAPWYSPAGSHMHFFTRLPWVNLLFSEKTVMKVRKRYRPNGGDHYEDVGLNRMSVRKFERLIQTTGFYVEYRRYDGVKGLDIATRIPMVRELLTGRLTCLLRAGSRPATLEALRNNAQAASPGAPGVKSAS